MKIWETKVDLRYEVWVERVAPYQGKLVVYDGEQEETLLEREVTISFDAPFGPDAGDVAEWGALALEIIDA